jgi:hypothetical protein
MTSARAINAQHPKIARGIVLTIKGRPNLLKEVRKMA